MKPSRWFWYIWILEFGLYLQRLYYIYIYIYIFIYIYTYIHIYIYIYKNILHLKSLRLYHTVANYDLDLGSDHRNVYTSLEIVRSTKPWTRRRTSFKGWKPMMDASRELHLYHKSSNRLMISSPPKNLHELENSCQSRRIWRLMSQRTEWRKETDSIKSH